MDDQDDLVFNEAVASGALRVHLAGDRALAQSHLREARRLLGQLRTTYGINARIAAGESGGFYRAHRQLPDGTRIEVYSNNGADVVQVLAPAAAAAVATVPERQAVPTGSAPALTITPPTPARVSAAAVGPVPEELAEGELEGPEVSETRKRYKTKSVLACGSLEAAGFVYEGWVWREVDGRLFVIPSPPLMPIPQNFPMAVSAGGHVVGYIAYFDADGSGAWIVPPYVWTEQDGTQLIEGTGQAFGVSADGSVIVGASFTIAGTFNENGTRPVACYWSRGPEGGYAKTPLPTPGGSAESAATDVSADGSVMVGTSIEFSGSFEAGTGINHASIVRWDRDGALSIISTISAKGAGVNDPVISGDGSTVAWNESNGGPLPDSAFGYYWTAESGKVAIGQYFYPNGLSYSGDVIYGAVFNGVGNKTVRWKRGAAVQEVADTIRTGAGVGVLAGDPSDQIDDDASEAASDESVEAYMSNSVGEGQLLIVRPNGSVVHRFAASFTGKLAIATLTTPADPPTGDTNE